MKYTKLMNKFLSDYYLAVENKSTIHNLISMDNNGMVDIPKIKNKKIGYIVATCSPPTKAHLELADKAI